MMIRWPRILLCARENHRKRVRMTRRMLGSKKLLAAPYGSNFKQVFLEMSFVKG